VIDKYQTRVFSTTCDSPTDAISDCLNDERVRNAFCRDVFLLGCCSCVQFVILWVFQCDRCKYLFISNKIVLTSLDEYFSNCFKWLSFTWQFAPHSSGAWPFLSTDISQGSVATRLRDGVVGYFIIALLQIHWQVCR